MMGLLHSGKYACCRGGTGRLTPVYMALMKLLNSPTWGRQLVGLLGVGDRPGTGAGGLGDGLAEILTLNGRYGPPLDQRLLALLLELSPTRRDGILQELAYNAERSFGGVRKRGTEDCTPPPRWALRRPGRRAQEMTPKPCALYLTSRYRNLEDAAVTPAAGQVGQVKSQSAACQATVCAHQRESGVGGVRREGRSGKTAEGRGDATGKPRLEHSRLPVMSPVDRTSRCPRRRHSRGLPFAVRRIRTTDAFWRNQCMLPCQVGRRPLKNEEERGERREERQGTGQRRGRD